MSKEEKRLRKHQVKIRLLDEELELLKLKAVKANLSQTELIRNLIVYGTAHPITKFSDNEARNLIYEINKIGTNVNQIAARVNGSGAVSKGDFNELHDTYLQLLTLWDSWTREVENGNNEDNSNS